MDREFWIGGLMLATVLVHKLLITEREPASTGERSRILAECPV